jgi:hypothetical protein
MYEFLWAEALPRLLAVLAGKVCAGVAVFEVVSRGEVTRCRVVQSECSGRTTG